MTALPRSFLRLPLAHRGLHDIEDGRPENSRAAIKAAIDNNYGIEIDIQMSRDGRAIVFHDYDLRRLTDETGAVRQQSIAKLQSVKLKGNNETIPTLPEILKLVNGCVPLLIEIKDQDGAMGPHTGEIEKAIAHDLENYNGDLAVMSFNPYSVILMKYLMPRIPRGLVTGAFREENWNLLPEKTRHNLRNIPDFDEAEASFISHNRDDLSRARIQSIRASGVPVLCWTITDAKTEMLAREYADNITFENYLPAHAAT